jgi:hypothetical protein
MNRFRTCLATAMLLTLAACAADRGDDAGGDDAEQHLEQVAAGREVRPLSDDIRAAVDDAARRWGQRDATVPHYGAPIFEPGNDNVAYFEVNLRPGWAVVTAAEPIEVVEFNPGGQGPTARLTKGTDGAKRIVRLDTALYVATDDGGRALGQSAASIVRIDRSKDGAQEVPTNAGDAMGSFNDTKNQRDQKSMQAGAGDLTPKWWWNNNPAPKRECRVPGTVPSYRQLKPHEGVNDSNCASGCGGTAWATIFGWASKQASTNSNDSAYEGLFRLGQNASGSVSVAPTYMNNDVGNLSWALRKQLGTFCVGDQGSTATWGMNNTEDFVKSRAPGVSIESRGNDLLIATDGLRDSVIDTVCSGRPAIIGIGTLFHGDGHYPIAKAYKDGMFELEMGWGGNSNGWYKAQTWYIGTVRH